MSKFATRRIDETYLTFTESIAQKFPGYVLDKDGYIRNAADLTVNLDQLLCLLRSKDLELYEQHKERFFGPQARFITTGAKE